MQRGMLAAGGLAVSAGAVLAAGAVFYMALLTGWWWLLACSRWRSSRWERSWSAWPARAAGQPTRSCAVRLTAGVAFVVFAVFGSVLRSSF